MTQPRIVDSARKHGVSDETILHAFNNPILVEDLDERMTMFIGPDRAGNLYEIGVVSTDGADRGPCDESPPEVPEVTMPRTVDEIINQAEELAARFEDHEPDTDEVRDASAFRELARRSSPEPRPNKLSRAVKNARDGHSWASIGAMVGTSGEAARRDMVVRPAGLGPDARFRS